MKITAAPHVRSDESTVRIMWSVVLSLLPVTGASIWLFGPSAVLVIPERYERTLTRGQTADVQVLIPLAASN